MFCNILIEQGGSLEGTEPTNKELFLIYLHINKYCMNIWQFKNYDDEIGKK